MNHRYEVEEQSDQELLAAKATFAQAGHDLFDGKRFVADLRASGGELDEAKALAAARAAISLNQSLAKSLTNEEWIDYARNSARPEIIPLNDQQMEHLKGGGFDWGAFGSAVAGGAVAGVPGAVAGALIYAAIVLF